MIQLKHFETYYIFVNTIYWTNLMSDSSGGNENQFATIYIFCDLDMNEPW